MDILEIDVVLLVYTYLRSRFTETVLRREVGYGSGVLYVNRLARWMWLCPTTYGVHTYVLSSIQFQHIYGVLDVEFLHTS